jgi:hypothetical protein
VAFERICRSDKYLDERNNENGERGIRGPLDVGKEEIFFRDRSSRFGMHQACKTLAVYPAITRVSHRHMFQNIEMIHSTFSTNTIFLVGVSCDFLHFLISINLF